MARVTPDEVFAAVEDIMSRPFVWAKWDCCTSVCDVFERLHGFDPMAAVRPFYDDVRTALRLIKSHGGMDGIVDHCAREAGLAHGHDVGGVSLSADHKNLLICIQPGLWAGKSLDGFALVREASRGFHAQTSNDHLGTGQLHPRLG